MENASKALIIAGAILISILLITIGVILINAGRDVTSTGTGQMNSQKIQTFNSQFTAYEGTRKGSEIKSLINAVNASNATDEEHQIYVYVTNAMYNGNATANPPVKAITNAGGFISTKSYKVEVVYSTNESLSTQTDYKGIINPTLFKTEKGYIQAIKISE